MAEYIPKSALVAEIEGRIEVYEKSGINFHLRISELKNILSFIDTLEVKEVQEEPVSEDLEEAAVEAFKKIVDSDKNNFLEIFKAGAKWQKEKACEWLKNNLYNYAGEDDKRNIVPFDNIVFEDFRKAMEGGEA